MSQLSTQQPIPDIGNLPPAVVAMMTVEDFSATFAALLDHRLTVPNDVQSAAARVQNFRDVKRSTK